MIRLIISARQKPDVPMDRFIRYSSSIESVFGFVEHCPLYGGRRFLKPELTQSDIEWLYERDIGFKIPLSTLNSGQILKDDYVKSVKFLEKYHRTGNSVTVANDDLARLIRKDFPLYTIDASAIKNIKRHDDIDMALELYDKVVLRSAANDDIEFLSGITQKNKIILFESIGRLHGCNSKLCFIDHSKYNSNWTNDMANLTELPMPASRCARPGGFNSGPDFQRFDIDMLYKLGFSTFKVMRQHDKKWAY